MIVLGVDPGLAATGYGVVERTERAISCRDYGCLRTQAGSATDARLRHIYDGICGVIQRWRPDLVVIEEVFAKEVAPRAAISIGEVIGVVLLATSGSACTPSFIASRAAKQAITGSGSAEKAQISRSLRRMLNLQAEIRPDHAADALGLAYVGALRYRARGQQ